MSRRGQAGGETTPASLVERGAAWLWWSMIVVLGAIGMVALHRDPTRVSIDEFAWLYQSLGLAHQHMITLLLTLPLAFAVAAAGLILAKRSADRTALLLAGSLCAVYFFVSGAGLGLDSMVLRNFSLSTATVLMSTFLVAFPSGRAEPRWAIVVPAGAIVLAVLRPELAAETRSLLVDSGFAGDLEYVAVIWVAYLGVAIVAQVIRYRSVSTPLERLQTRWVMFGIALVFVPPVLLLGVMTIAEPGRAVVAGLVAVSAFGSYAFPAAVAMAVFRHHLYDIDRIISRTVTYTLVAGVLALIYALPVVVLPALFGGGNDLIVAGSTLAAAAAFNPVRRRIQHLVDGRFNRTRFDAETEVLQFTDGLTDATDIGDLTGELEALLGRTLEPVSTGIWIKESE